MAVSQFFIDRAIDQMRFMHELLEPEEMLWRMDIYVEEEVRAKPLPKENFMVRRECTAGAGAGEIQLRQFTSASAEARSLADRADRVV